MALFGIQRYMGDEGKKESSSNANKILEELHRKAEQRAKELGKSPSASRKRKASDSTPTKHESPGHRSKKPALEKETSESDSDDSDDDSDEEDDEDEKKTVHAADDADDKVDKEVDDSDEEDDEDDDDDDDDDEKEAEMAAEDGIVVDSAVDTGDLGEQGDIRQKLLAHSGKSMDFTVLGEVRKQRIREVKRALPEWLAKPNVVAADILMKQTPLEDVTGIHDTLLHTMKKEGITHLFPVQLSLMRTIVHGNICPGLLRPRDICCSAPTGSGKTLAYVLPLLQLLMGRVRRQVQVLVVLPVADLANQVFHVFSTYSRDTGLSVARLTGHKPFATEQKTLVKKGLLGYECMADIVVATPGRLVDHLDRTPGFSLQHLRFLVMDEADRMMEEYKQDWLHHVEKACPKLAAPHSFSIATVMKREIYCQKLLFSATLSQNPEKLQELRLYHPQLFTSVGEAIPARPPVQGTESTPSTEPQPETKASKDKPVTGEFVGKYTTPKGLTEFYIEAEVGQKPLMILYMLHHLKFRRVLCFTNSVESTHRLYLLLKLVGGDVNVQEYSSKQNIHRRQKILKRFANGKIDMLICSDAMARGMEAGGEGEQVRYAVSYDAPRHLDTYVHRAGRTARAGRAGTAITLLEKKEIFHFKKMCKDVGKDQLKEMRIKRGQLKPYVESFQQALKKLPDILKKEKGQRL